MLFYQLACSAGSLMGYLLFTNRIMVERKCPFLLEKLIKNDPVITYYHKVVYCDCSCWLVSSLGQHSRCGAVGNLPLLGILLIHSWSHFQISVPSLNRLGICCSLRWFSPHQISVFLFVMFMTRVTDIYYWLLPIINVSNLRHYCKVWNR